MPPSTISHAICAAGLALGIAACNDSGNGPASDSRVSLNLATRSAAAGVAAASFGSVAAPETYTDGAGNTLGLDRVQLVLREIELENEAHDGACDGEVGDGTDCAEVEIGPLLVDLPLGTVGASRAVTVDVPAGAYDEVKFKIRQPEDDTDADAAFLAAHPDFAHTSIRVVGSYNGVAFTYESGLDAEMQLHLSPALVVQGTSTTDLTLFVDLDAWFRAADGDLVDPASANQGGDNEHLVADNIQRGFHAFEDEDHDGSDDHDGSNDHDALDHDDGTHQATSARIGAR